VGAGPVWSFLAFGIVLAFVLIRGVGFRARLVHVAAEQGGLLARRLSLRRFVHAFGTRFHHSSGLPSGTAGASGALPGSRLRLWMISTLTQIGWPMNLPG